MPNDHRAKLAAIKRFDQLIAYLRDEMGWPIARDSFEDVDDLFYDFTPDELGIDPKTAAKIQEIKRLRPLSPKQPWGIFFVKFEPKRLPVVALRRILSQVALKKRASANSAERAAWAADDLLFVSNYGKGDERQISFAHFSRARDGHDLPTLRVLGWDNHDTALHLDEVARELTEHLAWPEDEHNAEGWRTRWRDAFVLRHREVVTTSKQLSIRLAELARNIRNRIKAALAIETEKGALTKLMKAFQAALVHDLDVDGFADMYAQTIAYGLLSARIADPNKKTSDDFASHMRTNPFLRELMETFLTVGGRRGKAGGPGIDFDELGVSEVVDLLDDANMEAVVRDFGDRNPEEDPVIHFYELFLKEYDPRKRMQRGVFYTPRPVVSYIVRSVDELLRTEFGLADGLADTTTWRAMAKRKDVAIPVGVSPEDDFVQILDPATGTGTFLVEVIDRIYNTMLAKWNAQGLGEKKIEELWNEYVPRHLLPRLHGYELLMAPYAIAHLKIGLKLYETGYRFGSDERARVYLTNSLEPPHDFSGTFDFAVPALAHEAQAVNKVKRDKRYTVIIGNPPYAGHSANVSVHAKGLVHEYRFVDGLPLGERNPKWLQDDYVKFIRLGEKLLAQGILGYITNHSYADNPTFRGMRRSLMTSFGTMYFVDLHGNSKKNEKNPDGGIDVNIFDIQQGVAVLLGCKKEGQRGAVYQSDFWGARTDKYTRLANTSYSSTKFTQLNPSPPFYLFVPQNTDLRSEFEPLPSVTEIFPTNSMGVTTGDDARFVDLSSKSLKARFRSSNKLKQFAYRPFDNRLVQYDPECLARARADFMRHMMGHRNLALVTIRRPRNDIAANFFISNGITDKCFISSLDNCQVFPLWLLPEEGALKFSADAVPNLAPSVLKKIALALGLSQKGPHGLPDGLVPEDIFFYAYAVFHSPRYRLRYSEFLKTDFARLPVAGNVELFRSLVDLGRELVGLHLLESPALDSFITEFIGDQFPEVEKATWSHDTVWLDRGQSAGFKGIGEDVWSFHIGAYQVCEKWLKDRKGRRLEPADLIQYQKIVVALSETIRVMSEVDNVIERHGGWPAAFQRVAETPGDAQPLLKVAEPHAQYGQARNTGNQ